MSLCPYIFFPVHLGLDPHIGTDNYGQTISVINSTERFLVLYFQRSGFLNTDEKGTSESKSFAGLSARYSKFFG